MLDPTRVDRAEQLQMDLEDAGYAEVVRGIPVDPRGSLLQRSRLEPHARLRASLMRAHALLYADKDGLILSGYRSELGMAVSSFLKDVGNRSASGGGSSSRTKVQGTRPPADGRLRGMEVSLSNAQRRQRLALREKARERAHRVIH